ncbi:hypothetical protein [uncultured Brevundimonas sp.]|uniref:hypothetical protein n=1 Tax=uncultured Brevundimonas sp. TaxID=213418 RepID=UPI0026270179|nr:hypothetical protein [uncultured Brevundimonas sp.]
MATFTLRLDEYTLQKLTEAARKAEVTPERMAALTLEAWILADDGLDRGPVGVGEPARAWTGVTKDGGPGQRTTPEDHEGPFVDLDVALDALSAARITARAKMMGVTPEELATLALDSQFFDYDDFEWPEGGDPRTAVAEPIIEEELRDWEDVRPELEAYLEEKLKARR